MSESNTSFVMPHWGPTHEYPNDAKTILAIIGLNLVFVIFGYLFIGSLNSAIILSNRYKNSDIREHNSKNAGATNSLRTYGLKFALFVYFIDFFKTIIPVYILSALCQSAWPEFNKIYFISPQSLAFGTVLGHCWPIWFKFKGGKGVACSSAFMLAINPVLFLIAATVFFSTVSMSKKVSLGSIICSALFPIITFIPWFTQGITGFWMNNIQYSDVITIESLSEYWFVSGIYSLITAIIVISLHHRNIKRLIRGEERKISFKSNKTK